MYEGHPVFLCMGSSMVPRLDEGALVAPAEWIRSDLGPCLAPTGRLLKLREARRPNHSQNQGGAQAWRPAQVEGRYKSALVHFWSGPGLCWLYT